jgi:hypothetical protein
VSIGVRSLILPPNMVSIVAELLAVSLIYITQTLIAWLTWNFQTYCGKSSLCTLCWSS